MHLKYVFKCLKICICKKEGFLQVYCTLFILIYFQFQRQKQSINSYIITSWLKEKKDMRWKCILLLGHVYLRMKSNIYNFSLRSSLVNVDKVQQISTHLLKTLSTKNFIFCAVQLFIHIWSARTSGFLSMS